MWAARVGLVEEVLDFVHLRGGDLGAVVLLALAPPALELLGRDAVVGHQVHGHEAGAGAPLHVQPLVRLGALLRELVRALDAEQPRVPAEQQTRVIEVRQKYELDPPFQSSASAEGKERSFGVKTRTYSVSSTIQCR